MLDEVDAVAPTPLDVVARRIEEHSRESDEHVIKAAMLIGEARRRVNAGEAGAMTWYEWARHNIHLSPSRIRELMRIAEAKDPRRELERIRELNCERQKKNRKSQAALEKERKKLIAWAKSADIERVKLIHKQILRLKDAPMFGPIEGSKIADRPRAA